MSPVDFSVDVYDAIDVFYLKERDWAKGAGALHMGTLTIKNNSTNNVLIHKIALPFWLSWVAPNESLMSNQGWMYNTATQYSNQAITYTVTDQNGN